MIERTVLLVLNCAISLPLLTRGDGALCPLAEDLAESYAFAESSTDDAYESDELALLVQPYDHDESTLMRTTMTIRHANDLKNESGAASGTGLLQLAVSRAPTALTAGHESESASLLTPVTVFTGVWCVLAVLAVSYSFISASIEAEASTTPKAAGVSTPKASCDDDDVVHRSTSSRTRLLQRRATITVGEISRSAKYKTWNLEDAIGTLSSSAFVITVLCDIAPNGIVPLPHGVVSTGFVPTLVLLVSFYSCCVCTMWMIARTSFITGKMSFSDQWEYLIGPSTSWIPIAVLISVCFGNCVEYLCFVADLLTGCLPAFGLELSRTHCAWLFAMFPALPLCFLKDLSALAPTSFFGFASVVYLVFVICLRFYDGSYQAGGAFFQELPAESKPSVPKEHLFEMGTSSLVLLNALAMGFLPHYNGPKYYRELYRHEPGRFFQCTALGMGLAGGLYVIAMIVGYMTFGASTQAVITESYARTDMLMNIARLCLGISILASFPIMFSGLREAVVQLLTDFANVECSEVYKQNAITIVLVTVIAFLTQLLTDPGVVVGLVGAVCGIACIFLLPCTLYAAALAKDAMATHVQLQLFVTGAFRVLGVFLMVGGVYATFKF